MVCVCVYVSIHVHCSLQCYFQNRNEMQKKDSKTQQYSTPSSYTTKSLFEHSITHINNTVTWICNMWSDWKLFRSCCCSLLQCGFIVAPWTIFFSCMQLNFRSGFFDWFGFNAAFHKYKSEYESELQRQADEVKKQVSGRIFAMIWLYFGWNQFGVKIKHKKSLETLS